MLSRCIGRNVIPFSHYPLNVCDDDAAIAAAAALDGLQAQNVKFHFNVRKMTRLLVCVCINAAAIMALDAHVG